MTNVHIVGCPRSGTTLLTEMMAACFHIDGSCDHEETIFKVSAEHKGIYLSKKPNDILWIHRIIDRDPDLNVIVVMRDPRAVICSTHKNHPGMYFCNYPVWARAEKALAGLQNHPRAWLLRYEELVSDPDGVQAKLVERFSFLRIKHRFSDFHLYANAGEKSQKALGGIRPADEGRINGWKEHLPRLKQQVNRHPEILPILKKYGYESDDNWVEILKDAALVDFPCRNSGHRNIMRYLEQQIRFRGKIKHYLAARNL